MAAPGCAAHTATENIPRPNGKSEMAFVTAEEGGTQYVCENTHDGLLLLGKKQQCAPHGERLGVSATERPLWVATSAELVELEDSITRPEVNFPTQLH